MVVSICLSFGLILSWVCRKFLLSVAQQAHRSPHKRESVLSCFVLRASHPFRPRAARTRTQAQARELQPPIYYYSPRFLRSNLHPPQHGKISFAFVLKITKTLFISCDKLPSAVRHHRSNTKQESWPEVIIIANTPTHRTDHQQLEHAPRSILE